MKLFTPTQAKIESVKNREDEIAQVVYLNETLQRLQMAINNENDIFNKRLLELRTIYGEEKEKLQKEVTDLEQARIREEAVLRELLRPIDAVKREAEMLLEEAKEKKQIIDEEYFRIEDLQEMLQEKLDLVSYREQEVFLEEQRLINKEKGIVEEREMISQAHRSINDRIAVAEFDYQKRMKALIERENAVEGKIKANIAYLEAKELNLHKRELVLKDRLEMLERDITRFKLECKRKA